MISAETQLTLAMLRRQPRPGCAAQSPGMKRPTGGRRNPVAGVVLPEDRWIDSKLWHRKPAKKGGRAK
jgi:hypothetical protein